MLGTMELTGQIGDSGIGDVTEETRWHPAVGFLAALGVSALAWVIGGGLVWLAWSHMDQVVGAVLAWVAGAPLG
jgi:hypothetical protein